MTQTLDKATLDQWYCIQNLADIPKTGVRTRLLGVDLTISGDSSAPMVTACEDTGNRPLPVRQRYGYLWSTLGLPNTDVPDIPEAEEADRRYVPCGAVKVRSSAPRVIENFLDMAHFPFVHKDILGSEAHSEVEKYKCEIRRDVDEVWATDCVFTQPLAAKSATEPLRTDYIYRVTTPFTVLLYKTCPISQTRWDVICLFVQPMEPGLSRAHPVMFLLDVDSSDADLIAFQQVIFLQDRIILENQRPLLLPLEARVETPTRADATSIAYRRWLKEKGCVYGTTLGPALPENHVA
ncbi:MULTISPECIES: aromatic ring-hydroxylating oxygenase subunit alpha [Pacificibacter]|uniref:aromatic ring-hydroxylating oxygenase subunit alpha n=1 Tax=Pacificibacter TaxID=1042323 RepID=UPI001C09CF93|nr:MULTISPECIES: aromatic ring-hydroxylating dioxygenase subunit alpha [Pacificibacter]MBU2935577.1 aromatic ring-hydroxylating dioxygenase subunit alpha [Pacificibacter marinus]MDO6614073.1 aromatic ring-hydroxylating dioxygenase subunit alpha [Pacificibacter sp. 1_MG-2023]